MLTLDSDTFKLVSGSSVDTVKFMVGRMVDTVKFMVDRMVDAVMLISGRMVDTVMLILDRIVDSVKLMFGSFVDTVMLMLGVPVDTVKFMLDRSLNMLTEFCLLILNLSVYCLCLTWMYSIFELRRVVQGIRRVRNQIISYQRVCCPQPKRIKA